MAGSKTSKNIHSFNEAEIKINVDKATDHSRQSPNLPWVDLYDNNSSTQEESKEFEPSGWGNWESSNVSQGSDWSNNQADPNETNTKANLSEDVNTWGSNKQSSLPCDLNSSSQLPAQDKAEFEGSKETEVYSKKCNRYELVTKSLFWYDISYSIRAPGIECYSKIDLWRIQAHHLDLEADQKKLNIELLNIIDDCCQKFDFLGLQKFLDKNRENKHLKKILDLRRGNSKLTLLHMLPDIGDRHNNCVYTSDFAKILLAAGANPNIQDSEGETPLHHFAKRGDYEFIGLLTQHEGTDPNIQNYEGKTPLHYCADSACDNDPDNDPYSDDSAYRDNSRDCVDLLLAKGANVNTKDKDGKTPLQIAIDSNSSAVKILFNGNQEKLCKELYKLIEDTVQCKSNSFKYEDTVVNEEGVEKLKNFLDENKDNQDLKIILNVRSYPQFYLKVFDPIYFYNYDGDSRFNVVKDLLIKAGVKLIGEELFNENQRNLKAKLNKFVADADCAFSGNEAFCSNYKNPQETPVDYLKELYIQKLKKFLNGCYGPDLQTILSVKDKNGRSMVLDGVLSNQVRNLLIKAGAKEEEIVMKDKLASKSQFSFEGILQAQHKVKLNEFLSKVSKAKSMADLQSYANEAIDSGVMLNLYIEESNGYFLDCVIKRISELENNPKVASDIICDLISCGAKLKNQGSSKIFDVLASEYKDHEDNVLKAHDDYLNFSQKFLRVAQDATTGQLIDASLDNSIFCLEYSGNSEIDVAKITGHMKDLGLADGIIACGKNIIKIGKSEVEVETLNGKRNYTNLTGDITLTFHTSEGELKVRLHNMKENSDIIKVEVQDLEKWAKLKRKNEKVGTNCLLGGKSVTQAIEDGFLKHGKNCLSSEEVTRVSQKQLSPDSAFSEVSPVSGINVHKKSFQITS